MDIPKTMMAVVKTKRERGAEYLQVPVPEVGPDEALIKVHALRFAGLIFMPTSGMHGHKTISNDPSVNCHELWGMNFQVRLSLSEIVYPM